MARGLAEQVASPVHARAHHFSQMIVASRFTARHVLQRKRCTRDNELGQCATAGFVCEQGKRALI
jgi:hypothetical protein